jgi:hypothetical protein
MYTWAADVFEILELDQSKIIEMQSVAEGTMLPQYL